MTGETKPQRSRGFIRSAAVVAMAVGGLSSRANAISQYFFDWTNRNTGTGTNFADSPFLDDGSASTVAAKLAASQLEGKPLAVKVVSVLAPGGPAIQVLNQYRVQYVFADFEGPGALARTQALVTQVGGTSSANAFIGNFNYYPNRNQDPTSPSQPAISEYESAHTNMANPELYPGAPDYRNPASGNSSAPNIRSALFTLPIQRATLVTNGEYGRSLTTTRNGIAYPGSFNTSNADPAFDPTGKIRLGINIPYVTRFNNFGNPALDNSPAPGQQFVQNARNPANGQLPSRGDFEAQILHYRLRGVNSFHDFIASVTDRFGNAYTQTQQELDINTGWFTTGQSGFANGRNDGGSSVLNGIFATRNFGFANLSNIIRDDNVRSGGQAAYNTTEAEGAIWSGVFSRGLNGPTVAGKGVTASQMAILLSNLSNVSHLVDIGTVAGHSTFDPRSPGIQQDDFNIDPGTHRLLTFTLQNVRGRTVWDLTGNNLVFTDSDRNGVGTPEPASLGVFGMGALGLLARRRKPAARD